MSGRNSEGNYSFSRDVFLSVHINYLHEVRSLKVRINIMTVLWLLLLLSVFVCLLFFFP